MSSIAASPTSMHAFRPKVHVTFLGGAEAAAASAAAGDLVSHSAFSPAHVMWSVAEAFSLVPHIERPGEKGGDGIYVERKLHDAILPFNASLSMGIAFFTASANELTRTNKINDLVTYIAGEPPEDEALPPVLPWEWDRVGHDTAANLAKDCGAQSLTRALEIQTKRYVGSGGTYCELLKHTHKAAYKTYCTCKDDKGALAASVEAAKMVAKSPTFYMVRALTGWIMDVTVDAIAWWRGQLTSTQLQSNACLKAVKFSLSAAFGLAVGTLVPFVYPHPYVFLLVEQVGANVVADMLVSNLGSIEPS